MSAVCLKGKRRRGRIVCCCSFVKLLIYIYIYYIFVLFHCLCECQRTHIRQQTRVWLDALIYNILTAAHSKCAYFLVVIRLAGFVFSHCGNWFVQEVCAHLIKKAFAVNKPVTSSCSDYGVLSFLFPDCLCWWLEHAHAWDLWCSAPHWAAAPVAGSLELVWPQRHHPHQAGWLAVHGGHGTTRWVLLGVSLPACLPACLPICLPFCISACPPTWSSPVHTACLLMWLYTCSSTLLPSPLCAFSSVCLSVCLSACLPACVSAYLLVCLPDPVQFRRPVCHVVAHQFVHLAASLPACLPFCLSVCLPVISSSCAPVCPPCCFPAYLFSFCLPFCLCLTVQFMLPAFLPACLSASLSRCLAQSASDCQSVYLAVRAICSPHCLPACPPAHVSLIVGLIQVLCQSLSCTRSVFNWVHPVLQSSMHLTFFNISCILIGLELYYACDSMPG